MQNIIQQQKVLILSRGFGAGDAITTLNLFSRWPKANMFCASPIRSSFYSDFNQYYYMGNKEISLMKPFSYLEKVPSSEILSSHISTDSGKLSLLRRLYKSVGIPVMRWLDLYENRMTIHLSDSFKSWIRNIRPDVIYTSAGDTEFAKFILSVKKEFPEIPLVIHTFDDWSKPYHKLINYKRHLRYAEGLMLDCFKNADYLMCSSDFLKTDFSKKYNLEFHTFPNPVSLDSYFNDDVSTAEGHDSLRIKYIGKVSVHNAVALKNMQTAVMLFNKSHGHKPLVFDIYTQTNILDCRRFGIYDCDCVRINAPVPNAQIPMIIKASDILFLPISVSPEVARFTKYSMSTKMGEYLASGVPVIYCGPKGIAMSEFVGSNNCAYNINSDEVNDLIKAIEYIINPENISDINKMTLKAIEVSKQYFDINIISERFVETIKSLGR